MAGQKLDFLQFPGALEASMDVLQVLLRVPRHTESTKVAEHLRGAHRHLETGGSVAQLDAILQKNQIKCKMAAKGDGARPNYLPHVGQVHATKRLHLTLAVLHLDQAAHTPQSLAASDVPLGAQLNAPLLDFVGYVMNQRRPARFRPSPIAPRDQ